MSDSEETKNISFPGVPFDYGRDLPELTTAEKAALDRRRKEIREHFGMPSFAEIERLKARVKWLEAMLKAKDLLLVAHRVQDHDLADRALSKIEKLEAADRGHAAGGKGEA